MAGHSARDDSEGAAVGFILEIVLFVIVIGFLDARFIPWPKPQPAKR
jgi:hypothetical protein